jgi:hypothetical protein
MVRHGLALREARFDMPLIQILLFLGALLLAIGLAIGSLGTPRTPGLASIGAVLLAVGYFLTMFGVA